MMNRFLFRQIDNAPLLVFRILFGILISSECYGAIITGWITRTLVEPKFTFTFIGFEWLQPLPGYGMYIYFFIMGTLGILISIGYKYRFAMISFTVLWTGVYLMQKTSYNNHYYLLILISGIMSFLPANANQSFDAKYNPTIRSNTMFAYVKWIIILQLLIVYTYAAGAKLYADWLDFSFLKILMQSKADYTVIGPLLQHPWLHKIVSVSGILFDLLIIPALLWKPTRIIAFVLAICFHIFNSIVFQIGIFPYLALAFTVFFFEPQTIRKLFFRKHISYTTDLIKVPSYKRLFLWGWGLYFLIQLVLPIRHYFIKDKVLWTEEGHRMSWRMMLRSRSGVAQFKLVDKSNDTFEYVKIDDYLTKKQKRKIASYPDFIWQFAQYLKKENALKGKQVAIYVNSRVRINGKKLQPFIDPNIDIADEPWDHFRHHTWILPSALKTTE